MSVLRRVAVLVLVEGSGGLVGPPFLPSLRRIP